MTATAVPPTPLAAKAAKLVAAAERQSFDPVRDIDWPTVVDDSAYHLPPEFLPLYGTELWEAMDEPTRIAYSRHCCAALCAAGIWFENVLMQLLLRQLVDQPATDPTQRFLLVEVADECRHSTMFGEFIRRAGTPAYQVPVYLRLGARLGLLGASGPEAYAAILAAEELLDVSNRATMADERVHPLSRRIARIHVLEESRHVSFARTAIAEGWPELPRWRKVVAQVRAPFLVGGVAMAMVHPGVARALGLPHGTVAAHRNPHHQARIRRDLGRLTGFLGDVGMLTSVTRPVWRALGLC